MPEAPLQIYVPSLCDYPTIRPSQTSAAVSLTRKFYSSVEQGPAVRGRTIDDPEEDDRAREKSLQNMKSAHGYEGQRYGDFIFGLEVSLKDNSSCPVSPPASN
jgi:hypothetical protein